jgi:pentatricopeptide repeat protein
MLRYFALLADIKSAGLTVRLTQWNYALAFVQQSKNWVTSQDNESALQLWREMEHQAGIRGNGVTFNILFDVASKTGNFVLADMIHKEMENRGIHPNRYNHVSLIHFFGLKQDSDGMLAAYKEMVDSGELIDTVVLNCLISGFLRCGDEGAAEQLYERMKDGLGRKGVMPERDYTTSKIMTQVLMMFAKVGKKHPALKQSFQNSVALTPDLQTYKLLIEHHAVRVGDLGKVTKYLDEMKRLDIPVHATIFLALLKGFFHWGGTPTSAWSKQRLDGVLSALYEARDQRVKDFRIRRWLVLWGMRAMKKCSGDNAEVERMFDEMSLRWDIPLDGQQFLEAVLEKILSDEDMNSPRGNWGGVWQRVKKDGSRL